MRFNKKIYLVVGSLVMVICGLYYVKKTVYVKQSAGVIPTENKDVDSFRLLCMLYACDCPNWVDYKKYTDYQADTSMDKKEFDTYFNDSYYIEGKGATDYIEGNIGLVIDFFGKLDTTRRLSKEDIYMDAEPIKGKIFMYSRYKIIDHGVSRPHYPPDYTEPTDLGRPENQ